MMFLQVVYQALEYQAVLVESLSKMFEDDGEDLVVKGNDREKVIDFIDNEETFEGFGEAEVRQSSAKLEVLNIIKRQLNHTRSCVEVYCSENLDKRKNWKRRYEASDSMLEVPEISSEISDTVSDLPIFDLGRSHIFTRSKGSIDDNEFNRMLAVGYRARAYRRKE